jgi:transposase
MTGKSTKQSRRKYDVSFKEDVLKTIVSGGPVTDISKALGNSENVIYTWKKKAEKKPDRTSENGNSTDSTAEIERLKAELRRTEQERDIIKKALGIFSRGI